MKCSNCGKTAVLKFGDDPYCVECYKKKSGGKHERSNNTVSSISRLSFNTKKRATRKKDKPNKQTTRIIEQTKIMSRIYN